MKLVIERASEDIQYLDWDDVAIKRYKLVKDDVDCLNSGCILWRGTAAFSLEENEDNEEAK